MTPVGELIPAPVRGRQIVKLTVAEMADNGRALALVAPPIESPAGLADNVDAEPDVEPDVFEATGRILADALRSDRYSMEFPFFALSADHRVRVYERNGVTLTVLPGAAGCATMYDKAVWIYCISEFVAAKNHGKPIGRKVRFHGARYFSMLGRKRSTGQDYDELTAALDRLSGTRIKTNIKIGGKIITGNSGLIDGYAAVRAADGRSIGIEVTLPDWLLRAVQGNEILKLDPAYFSLRRAIHRRVYELARKHCNDQKSWPIALAGLHQKIGSQNDLKKTREVVRGLIKSGSLPGYTLALDMNDIVTFKPKGAAGD